jgi:hypothetical protein
VILGVPGAAEKAARDANFFLGGIRAPEIRINISTHFDDSGLREAERRAAALGGIGFTPQPGTNTTGTGVSGGGGRTDQGAIDPRIPRFAVGGIVTRPTLAVIGEQGPEAIIPLNKDGSTGGLTLNFYGDIVADDAKQLMDSVVRMVENDRDGARTRLNRALRK